MQKRWISIGLWVGVLLPMASYGWQTAQRPRPTAIAPTALFEGILYQRQILQQPRPQVIHIVTIDLTAPGLMPLVTPSFDTAQPNASTSPARESLAQTTSEFLSEQGVQLAINANFFFPFSEKTPWRYGPTPGTAVNIIGQAISDGDQVSLPSGNYSTLCFLPGRAEIIAAGSPDDSTDCPAGTRQAIAGQPLFLNDLSETERTQAYHKKANTERPYPVNVAGLSATGEQLWLILVDGKQPLYSEGMTLTEAIARLKDLGAQTALKLDGGGSTTLAIEGQGVMNAVIHTKVPGRERPVANHLGFFAQPVTGPEPTAAEPASKTAKATNRGTNREPDRSTNGETTRNASENE